MTFASFTNIIVALLCAAVVLQSVRMMRNIQAMKSGDLADTIKSLDRATLQARTVLGDLKEVLRTDGAAYARNIASGEELRDELSVMVGIGNAVADRIMEAASATGERRETPAEAPAEEPVTAAPTVAPAKRSRRRRSSARSEATTVSVPAYAGLQ